MLNDRARRELRGADLLPADGLLACRADDLLRPVDEARIACGRHGRGLVAADVQVRPRSQRGKLADDVADEPVRRFAIDAQPGRAHADACVHSGAHAVARELRIGDERRSRVAGKIDLRDNRHVAPLRIRDDGGVLCLRVVAAAPSAHLGAPANGCESRP